MDSKELALKAVNADIYSITGAFLLSYSNLMQTLVNMPQS